MAQVQHNEFTEIAFSEEAEEIIRRSFTPAQLQFLQNFRAAAARNILNIVFGAGEDQVRNIHEHAYQRGKIDLISELLSDVAASQQRALDDAGEDVQQPGASQ
jgi:hypothetical protein